MQKELALEIFGLLHSIGNGRLGVVMSVHVSFFVHI